MVIAILNNVTSELNIDQIVLVASLQNISQKKCLAILAKLEKKVGFIASGALTTDIDINVSQNFPDPLRVKRKARTFHVKKRLIFIIYFIVEVIINVGRIS